MAQIGDTNFSMKPNVDMASIASLFQKKASDEQTMKLQQSQMESQQQDRVMNVMKMATELTQNLISTSQQNLMKQSIGHISDAMGMMTSQPTAETQPAGSSLFPGMTTAAAGTKEVPFTSTPEGQNYVKQNAIKAYPEEAGKALTKELFNPPDKEQIKTVQNPDGTAGYVRVNMQSGEVKPVSGIAAPAGAMGAVNLTPEDRTNKSLNAAADAYIRGDALPSQIFSPRTANGQKAIALALEKDPTFNTTDYQVKADMKKDYTTKGISGKNLTALSTTVNHLDRLYTTGEQLNNDDLQVWNKVKNKLARATGNPKVDRMLADRDAVTSELGRVFQGVGQVTQEERNEFRTRVSEASSPEQIKAVAEEWIQLMSGRIDPLKESWNTKLQGETPAVPFVTKQAANALKKHGIDPETLKPMNAMNSGGSLEEQKAALRKKLGL